MELNVWLTYVGTILILMSTPGPSQLLMLSNSMSNGFQKSLFTASGDLSANFLQMTTASVGLVGVIAGSPNFFIAVKWVGVGYLIYSGVRSICSKGNIKIDERKGQRSGLKLYWQGFLTSAANPKAVIFFAALFPQFIDQNSELLRQFIVLSSTYLLIDGALLCTYGKFADLLRRRLVPIARRYLNKISGIFLIIAAILLGLKDIAVR